MIAEYLTALYSDAPVIEVRILTNGHTDSGYFNDYTKLERALKPYIIANKKAAIYFTANPCTPDLLSRYNNRIEEYVKEAARDVDITQRRYLPLDFDPIRLSNTSSTDKQHKEALSMAQYAKGYLRDIGWPNPVEVDSGNGALLLYAIDLPNDTESTQLLKNILEVADHLFTNTTIKLDQSMFNAARIVRMPGTKNTKGDSTEEQPHRMAEILAIPEPIVQVNLQLLKNLANAIPNAPKTAPIIEKFDIANWLETCGLHVHKVDRWLDAVVYTLDHCAFNPEHEKAAIFHFDAGNFGYKCFHDSCSKKTWASFTKLHPLPYADQVRSAKVVKSLNDLGYFFRLNQCADRIEVNGAPITDPLAAKIRVRMGDKGYKPASLIEDCMYANALDNSYHPIKDYLSTLPYDAEFDAITALARCLCDRDDVAYTWLKHWLVGAVAKVYEAEQNPMLVLAGAQDLGKSTFVRYLASGMPNFFIESGIQPDRADDKLRLTNSWIWEVAELGATTRKADIEGLKYFITMRSVTVRKPYGHYDMQKPALSSFVGTVNPDGAGFLVDTTGNRRFLTLELTGLDWGYSNINVNHVWAQAYHLYRNGFKWQLQAEQKQIQNTINRRYEVNDPYIDLLHTYFEIDPTLTCWLSSLDILNHLRTHVELRGEIKRQAMDLAKACGTIGLEKARVNNVYGYYGIQLKETLHINFSQRTRKISE